jgi:hypothetical protein
LPHYRCGGSSQFPVEREKMGKFLGGLMAG